MKSKWFAMLVIAALGLMLLSACSKKETAANEGAPSAAAPAQQATPIDQSTVGSVKGSIKYTGPTVKPAKIDMSQDAACKGTNTVETVVADNGNLANAFVYVKSGLGDRTFTTPT